MTKRSGFAVKITAFIEANADDMHTMQRALSETHDVEYHLKKRGFTAVKMDSRFMLSKDIPDAPAALAQEQVEERAAQGAVGHAHTAAEQMPPIPPNLDRRRA